MKEGKLYKAIKSDWGLGITIIGFLIAILTPYYNIRQDVALINQNVGGFSDVVKEINRRNDQQDTLINDNSNRTSRIEGTLSQRAVASPAPYYMPSIRPASTTNE